MARSTAPPTAPSSAPPAVRVQPPAGGHSPPALIVDAVQAVQGGLRRVDRRLAPAPFALLDIAMGRWRPSCLALVARLGIADLLASGPKDIGELAQACEAHEQSLYRVLRALARDGVFDEPSPRQFALNRLSAPLQSGVPNSVRHTVMYMGSEWSDAMWPRLEHSVRTGEPVFPIVHGRNLWEYFDEHPAAAADYHGSMVELTRLTTPLMLGAYDFGQFGSIVDIGGGGGQFIASLLAAYPTVRGVNFDLETSLVDAPQTMSDYGVVDRCDIVAGSLHEEIPTGHDAYVMKHIAHGFGDEQLAKPLSNIRQAMATDGKLFLIEMLVREAPADYPQFLDLHMLMGSDGGYERSAKDFARLLEDNDFCLTDIIETASPAAIIVAEPRPAALAKTATPGHRWERTARRKRAKRQARFAAGTLVLTAVLGALVWHFQPVQPRLWLWAAGALAAVLLVVLALALASWSKASRED